MRGGSDQTDRLIILNTGQLMIASKNAANTHDLAVQASKQATNLANSVQEEHKLALAAQVANTNALGADRPWLGAIAVTATPMEANKEITVKMIVINSGRRPALISKFKAASNVMVTFPKEPTYPNSTPWPDNSESILMPGTTAENSFTIQPIIQPLFDALTNLTAKFYVYAIIEYKDPGNTNQSIKRTTACGFWSANKISAAFLNRPEYNEAN